MQKRQKRSAMITITILFALLICGTVSATDMNGAWNSSGDGVYTSTAGDVQVNASAKTYWWKGSWTDVGNGTTNPNGSFFSNPQAANHKSLQSTFGGSGILTFNFSENVTNPILHVDRIGSAVKHGKAYSSTSAKFTLGQPIVKLTGPNHFIVTSNSFYRTPYQITNGNREASWFNYKGTAAGSIKFIGAFDSVSLYWTSLGKCNLDEIEFVWELKKPKSKLVVTKNGTPGSINAGELLTYSMSIKNKGPSVARNVSFTDTLPVVLTNTQYSLDNINWAAYISGQSVNLGDLTVNQTVNFWIRGIFDAATQPGKISNTVTAFIKGKESGNATVKNNVTSKSDLVVSKSGTPSTVKAGELLTYSMSIKNNGPSVARNVTFTDTLPVALTNAQYSLDNINWAVYTSGQSVCLGDLAVNQTVNFWIRGIVDAATQPGTVSNTVTAYINGTESGNATANNTVVSKSKLTVTKNGTPSSVNAGELLTYSMSIKNNGPSVAHNVSFRDTLPVALTNAQYSLDNINWAAYTTGQSVCLGDLAVNQTVNFWIRGIVDAATQPGTIFNTVTAYINGTESGNATANNTVTNNAVLTITKTPDKKPAQYNVGDTVTYTIKVKNIGVSTTHNVVVTDTVPNGLQYIGSSDGGSLSAGVVTWNVGNLASGAEVIRTVTFKVLSAAAGKNVVNTATAIHSLSKDPASTTASIYVPSADLVLSKTVDNSKPKVKDTIHFTLIVNNLGPDTAVDVEVADKLPAGLSFVSSTINYGTYDPITGIWNIGNLPNGARAILTIAVIVESSGQITNEAKVSSVTYDPNIDANTAGVTIDVQEPQPPEPPIDPVNPVVDSANTVAMQSTGTPIAGIVLALFLLSAGLLMPRRKQ